MAAYGKTASISQMITCDYWSNDWMYDEQICYLKYNEVHIFSFFFLVASPTAIYTLSLHDALPISPADRRRGARASAPARSRAASDSTGIRYSGPETAGRSEEHTSELQSLAYLVCRLLLEKKKL